MLTRMLTSGERRSLKAKAHKLEPVVHIGAKGLTDEVVAEIERALTAHELIKVRAAGLERDLRNEALASICGKTGADLGLADHSAMNWDEVVAFLLILVITPPGLGWQAFAFFAFRFFDVVKPPPIRYFDRTIKGGFGVMFDDIAAAFYTLLAMAIAKQLFF